MRFFIFGLFFLFGSFNILYSKDKEQATSVNSEKKEELLNMFLEYPLVKTIYETCLKEQKDKSLKTSVADCIWNKVDDKTKNDFKNAISSKEYKKDFNRKPADGKDPIDKEKEKKEEE